MTQQVELEKLTPAELAREVRTLRYQKRQLGKQLGRAGATIFALRNEVAGLRGVAHVTPGDHARLLEQLRMLHAENVRLQDKLDSQPVPYVPTTPEGDDK